jgi:hypothetical protein
MQCFVDSQFYGLELFPLLAAEQMDTARKVYMCTLFNLPRCTAKNLVCVVFPAMPSVYVLLKRRASFYERALAHDIECVREAFLFDMCQFYPDNASWTAQLVQIFDAIGVDLRNDISSFPRHLRDFNEIMTDPEVICFHCVRYSDEKTLSFFRAFPDVLTATSFRTYLSSLRPAEQELLLLFLSSGLRWRFFISSSRGSSCPCCGTSFWSWEHFLSCPQVPVHSCVAELIALGVLSSWHEVSAVIKRTVLSWLSLFRDTDLALHSAEIQTFFH